MKQLIQKQLEFISELAEFEEWNEKFNNLMSYNDLLPIECPVSLLPYRITTCQSRTYFHAWIEGQLLRVNGWSNSPVQCGIIVAIIDMFNWLSLSEFTSEEDIFFHEKSGLMDHLTPLRQEGLREIIRRINVLFKDSI